MSVPSGLAGFQSTRTSGYSLHTGYVRVYHCQWCKCSLSYNHQGRLAHCHENCLPEGGNAREDSRGTCAPGQELDTKGTVRGKNLRPLTKYCRRTFSPFPESPCRKPHTHLVPNHRSQTQRLYPDPSPTSARGPCGVKATTDEPPSISAAVYTTSSWVGLSAAQKDELFHDV